jgi:hypothetical protein
VVGRVLTENPVSQPDRALSLRQPMPRAAGHHTVTAPQPVNPASFSGWDALVAAHPGHSFFHSSAWAATLQGTYCFEPVYFIARAANGSASILPLMEVDSWLTGRRGIGLPYTDECEPLAADTPSMRDLIEAAMAFGRMRRWKSVEWRGGRELFPEAPASQAFYGHKVILEPDENRMFHRLESSVQRAIRKAEKNGVTVTVSQSLEATRVFYSLHCKTRRKHGLPPQSFDFFQNIFDHIVSKNLGMIAIASSQQRPVAASVYLQTGTRAVYKFGASDESLQHLRGANLVMWEAIKWLAGRGATTLHLGRSSFGNEGLRKFKLGWGAAEESIEYVKYDLRKHAFVTETDESTGWYNRVFNVLPVGVSRMAGAFLYRHCA